MIVLGLFVVLTVIRGLLLYGREVQSFHLTVDLAAQLRSDLFRAAAGAPWRVLAAEPRGHLLGLLTTEVDRIVNGTVMLLRLPALGVMAIYSTSSAFAALKAGGAVVTWGDPDLGGDSSAVAIREGPVMITPATGQ